MFQSNSNLVSNIIIIFVFIALGFLAGKFLFQDKPESNESSLNKVNNELKKNNDELNKKNNELQKVVDNTTVAEALVKKFPPIAKNAKINENNVTDYYPWVFSDCLDKNTCTIKIKDLPSDSISKILIDNNARQGEWEPPKLSWNGSIWTKK